MNVNLFRDVSKEEVQKVDLMAPPSGGINNFSGNSGELGSNGTIPNNNVNMGNNGGSGIPDDILQNINNGQNK